MLPIMPRARVVESAESTVSILVSFSNSGRNARLRDDDTEDKITIDFTTLRKEDDTYSYRDEEEGSFAYPSSKRGTFARQNSSLGIHKRHKEVNKEEQELRVQERKRKGLEKLTADAELVYQKLLVQDNHESNDDEDRSASTEEPTEPLTAVQQDDLLVLKHHTSKATFTYISRLVPVNDSVQDGEATYRAESSLIFHNPGVVPIPLEYIECDQAAPFYGDAYY